MPRTIFGRNGDFYPNRPIFMDELFTIKIIHVWYPPFLETTKS